MGIEAKLDEDLKAGMRARHKARVDCVRQVRAKAQEAVNAKGFSGKADDAFYQEIIGSYVKSLQKGIEELEGGGDRAEVLRESYRNEITYLSQYLPQLLDDEKTRELVSETIRELGLTDVNQMGKLMGNLMKAHKGKVDPGAARRIAEELLGC